MSHQNEIVVGSLALMVCGGIFGAAIVDEARWRYRDWRRRRRQSRVADVDLTRAKPS